MLSVVVKELSEILCVKQCLGHSGLSLWVMPFPFPSEAGVTTSFRYYISGRKHHVCLQVTGPFHMHHLLHPSCTFYPSSNFMSKYCDDAHFKDKESEAPRD